MLDLVVGELVREELPQAAEILGRAYRDNPLNLALLGDDPELRTRVGEAIHAIRIEAMPRPPLGARRGGQVIGVCGFETPGGPGLSPDQQQRMVGQLSGAGPDVLMKAGEMLAEFEKHAPSEVHWKLGPVAVDPLAQGGGAGSLMVERFCQRLDETGAVACLDTDQMRNVRLYQRFGFEVADEGLVLGVQMWFMRRQPGAVSA